MSYCRLSIWHKVFHLFSWLPFQFWILYCLSFAALSHKMFQQFLHGWDCWYCMSVVQYFFYFLDHKYFLKLIFSVSLCKHIFVFWHPHMVTNFEFRNFFIMLKTIVNIGINLNISQFHFNCSICLVVYVNCLI